MGYERSAGFAASEVWCGRRGWAGGARAAGRGLVRGACCSVGAGHAVFGHGCAVVHGADGAGYDGGTVRARRVLAGVTIAACAFVGIAAGGGQASAATGSSGTLSASRGEYDARTCLDFAAWSRHHSRARLERVYEASRRADTYLKVDGRLLWLRPGVQTARWMRADCSNPSGYGM